MSELIQQSYAGVKKSKDVKDVEDGKYNLIGPNDQVIPPTALGASCRARVGNLHEDVADQV